MSYDLYLYRVPPGVDPLDACQAAFEAAHDRSGAPGDSPERMLEIAAAVRALDPALELKQGGVGGHAFVMLQSAASGIQVWLFPTCASVDVSFWHSGARAAQVWRDVWSCLAVLEREIGARTYDPQQDRVLDLEADFDSVLAQYAGGVQMLEEILENPPDAG